MCPLGDLRFDVEVLEVGTVTGFVAQSKELPPVSPPTSRGTGVPLPSALPTIGTSSLSKTILLPSGE